MDQRIVADRAIVADRGGGSYTNARFARISADDRRNVLEIVRETKTGLPDYWKN